MSNYSDAAVLNKQITTVGRFIFIPWNGPYYFKLCFVGLLPLCLMFYLCFCVLFMSYVLSACVLLCVTVMLTKCCKKIHITIAL